MVYFYVGIAGTVGALLRYAVSLPFVHSDTLFPYGTLIVNLIGCYVLALVTRLFHEKVQWNRTYQIAITTGLVGSFTTFSTFSVEVIQLMELHHYLLSFLYVCISLFGGLACSYLGYYKSLKSGDCK
ncbi:fluoride efflux transporter CrcB [Gracilibacillus marinus]|uniref:Fluoride-specific ion channel FluC n=1 Tax=Gracilibacillus marinus TaxID=630535 RepID=A0ABV8VSH0_9BACI